MEPEPPSKPKVAATWCGIAPAPGRIATELRKEVASASSCGSDLDPRSRSPLLKNRTLGTDSRLPIILISDPGQDLDDEMAFVMLRYLVHEKLVDVKGIICTLHPTFDRARLCRGTLDCLGLYDVPVGVGSDGGDQAGTHKASTFERWAHAYMPLPGSERVTHLEPGCLVLSRLFEQAEPQSLTILAIASLKDIAIFVRDNSELFAKKAREVVIMGGVQDWAQDPDEVNNACELFQILHTIKNLISRPQLSYSVSAKILACRWSLFQGLQPMQPRSVVRAMMNWLPWDL